MNNPRKKILYIITKSNFGGAQRYVYDLATQLPTDTFDVLVACGGNGPLVEKLHVAGIQTHTITNYERDIHIGKELGAMQELYALIRSFKPDIVHLNSSKAGGSGALIARLLGVHQIIFTAHGWPFFENRNFWWRSLTWFFSYLTVLLVHTVIVVSAHDAKNARMPFVRRKMVHIPIGIPPIPFMDKNSARAKLFSESVQSLHRDDLWVVSTGEHTKNKNLFFLLDAIRIYNTKNHPRIFLTFMGNGEDTVQLEQYAQERGIAPQVSFLGFIENARVYLRAFDTFVIPSRKEGLPYGLLEAGLAGLPCIGSNVGGIPEVIHHNETGLLTDSASVDSLVRSFEEFAGSSEKRASYGQQLEKKVTEEYTLSALLQKTFSLYSKNK